MQERYNRLILESTKEGDCIICHLTPSQIYANIKGYGKAHRFVWEYNMGIITDDRMVCHQCDNPRCINIEHLFLGTAADNMNDKVAKNRQHKGGPGRILTKEQINEAKDLYNQGYTFEQIGNAYGVNRRTIARSISILT